MALGATWTLLWKCVAIALFLLPPSRAFCVFSACRGTSGSPQCPAQQQGARRVELWNKLGSLRRERDSIRAEIVRVVESQRRFSEESRAYLRLEAEFLSLLQKEDAVVLTMEGVVKRLTKNKTLSRNVCSMFNAYISEP